MEIVDTLRLYELPLLLSSLAAGAALFWAALRRRTRLASVICGGLPENDMFGSALRVAAAAFTAFALNSLTDFSGKLWQYSDPEVYGAVRMIIVVFWIAMTMTIHAFIERRVQEKGAAGAKTDVS